MSHFASATKIDWSPDPDRLEKIAATVAERAIDNLDRSGIIDDPQPNLVQESPPLLGLRTLPADAYKLLLSNSISPLPLHKTLVLLTAIESAPEYHSHLRLALARAVVSTISNLHFGPEVIALASSRFDQASDWIKWPNLAAMIARQLDGR